MSMLKNSGNSNVLKKYKSLSNIPTYVVRMASREDTAHLSDAVSQHCHSNPKQFWQWINSLKGYRSFIPPLHDSGAVFVKDSDKALLFLLSIYQRGLFQPSYLDS